MSIEKAFGSTSEGFPLSSDAGKQKIQGVPLDPSLP
jgi:hypothetical protein